MADRELSTVPGSPNGVGFHLERVHRSVVRHMVKYPLVVALSAFVTVRLLVLLTLHLVALHRGRDAHALLVRWDGQWYGGIAESGYGATSVAEDGRLLSDYAFFPLFPLLERGVASVTTLTAVDAGLGISAVSSVVAAWGIFKVTAGLYGNRVGIAATVLWGLQPVGVVQSMAYSESLFTALAVWALIWLLARQWILAGLLASLAGLTRPLGAAIIGAVVVAAVLHVCQKSSLSPARWPRSSFRPLAGALLATLGWLGYVAWVGLQVGSVFGYFEVQAQWGNGVDGGAALLSWTWSLLRGPSPIEGVLVVLGASALVALFARSVREKQPGPFLVFSGLVIALALTTSGYFGSRPRYLIPAFPLLLPLARLWVRQPIWVAVPTLLVLTAAACTYGAVWLLGDGPP